MKTKIFIPILAAISVALLLKAQPVDPHRPPTRYHETLQLTPGQLNAILADMGETNADTGSIRTIFLIQTPDGVRANVNYEK